MLLFGGKGRMRHARDEEWLGKVADILEFGLSFLQGVYIECGV